MLLAYAASGIAYDCCYCLCVCARAFQDAPRKYRAPAAVMTRDRYRCIDPRGRLVALAVVYTGYHSAVPASRALRCITAPNPRALQHPPDSGRGRCTGAGMHIEGVVVDSTPGRAGAAPARSINAFVEHARNATCDDVRLCGQGHMRGRGVAPAGFGARALPLCCRCAAAARTCRSCCWFAFVVRP